MIILNIDNTGTFEIYKTWFIAIDDHIIKYNINYKKFLFKTLSKSKIMSFIIKLIKEDIIDWKVVVIIF